MLDVLDERLILAADDPVAFDHDCREGICGMCGVVIDGRTVMVTARLLANRVSAQYGGPLPL